MSYPLVDKLREVLGRYDDLERELSDPAVAGNPGVYRERAKAHADLTPIVTVGREYIHAIEQIEEARQIAQSSDDPELKKMAEDEAASLAERVEALANELQVLLLPRDPNDEKDVIVEIRAAAGGEEAALFAGDLSRMYMRFAERRGWKVALLSSTPTGIGGYKEIVFSIAGRGAYSELKHESGVHRVQRVPVTESSGRIHTSTATVAVLPEASEVEVEINPADVKMDTFIASSAGGQHMQKNETAVRLTHLPTGIVAQCQDERSQLQNREKAMRYLRARLYELELREQQEKISSDRRSQVGTGDRSEKIRTYNFPQDRITDHRVGVTLHNMDMVLDGEIQVLVDALRRREQEDRLAQA
jgi:peptide chain release factor 1